MITIKCPNCNQLFEAEDSVIGERIECAVCGTQFQTEEQNVHVMKLEPNQIIPDKEPRFYERLFDMMRSFFEIVGGILLGVLGGLIGGISELIQSVFIIISICIIGLVVFFYFYDGFTPPVEVTFRETLVPGDHTKVLQVRNNGKDTLALQIDAYNDDYNQHATHTFTVKPGRLYEIGRIEMNWQFERGERYTIKAMNYLFPYNGTVP